MRVGACRSQGCEGNYRVRLTCLSTAAADGGLRHGFEGVEQSLVFAADLAPIVWHCSIATGRRPVRICDVGAASGAGSNLLCALQNNLHGWPTEMTCFEVKRKYERYAERFEGIAYKVGDVFLDDSPVDVAIASHVIEHVEDPEDFVNRLLGRTGFFVVGYVPFLEREPRCPKHLHSFDDSRIRNMPGFLWGRVMRSSGWRTTEDARVVAFVCAPPAAEQLDLEVCGGVLTRSSRLGLCGRIRYDVQAFEGAGHGTRGA